MPDAIFNSLLHVFFLLVDYWMSAIADTVTSRMSSKQRYAANLSFSLYPSNTFSLLQKANVNTTETFIQYATNHEINKASQIKCIPQYLGYSDI